jgi:hypothetical protein
VEQEMCGCEKLGIFRTTPINAQDIGLSDTSSHLGCEAVIHL